MITQSNVTDTQVTEVFVNFAKYLVEFFRMSRYVNREYLSKYVKLNNEEVIERVLSKGKGGIFLSLHLGNWELGGVLLSSLGYPVTSVALRHQNKNLNDLFNKERSTGGAKVVQLKEAGRACMSALRNNEFIALIGDKDFSQNGIEVDFLNQKVILPKGPAAMSLKTGAPLIPSLLIRNKDNTFTFFFDEPIVPPEGEEITDESIKKIINQYIPFFEEKIRRYSTQWVVFREFDKS